MKSCITDCAYSVVQSVYKDAKRYAIHARLRILHPAKDAEFKITVHIIIMPARDLPSHVGVDLEEYFENPAPRSDGLRIYPIRVNGTL